MRIERHVSSRSLLDELEIPYLCMQTGEIIARRQQIWNSRPNLFASKSRSRILGAYRYAHGVLADRFVQDIRANIQVDWLDHTVPLEMSSSPHDLWYITACGNTSRFNVAKELLSNT